MARVARINAELFDGVAYWADEAEYWDPSEGAEDDETYSYVNEDDEYFAKWVDPNAKQSTAGVFERSSGEHGAIWLPCPKEIRFIGSTGGHLLASVCETNDGWLAYLQPTLSLFFGSAGGIFPIQEDAMKAALRDRVPLGKFDTFEEAKIEVNKRGQIYGKESRKMY